MQLGITRFEFYLLQLEGLMQAAAKTDNPAWYLYKNDARTKAFMLEGLAKLYAGINDAKKFGKIKAHFKLLEDGIGSIDYYDGFEKVYTTDKKIPNEILIYIQKRKDESIAIVNKTLLEKKWIHSKKNRFEKTRKKLSKIEWQSPIAEMIGIKKFYIKSIIDINDFYKATGTAFSNLEGEVHELRRKLRWLSIYPQALQGAIQFSSKNIVDAKVKKYLTKAIVQSPYNVLPAKAANEKILLLEKSYFLAMSNIIAALGQLKDGGLGILLTKEALMQGGGIAENVALQKACKINKVDKNGLANILTKAKKICKPFFAEQNLEKMMTLI